MKIGANQIKLFMKINNNYKLKCRLNNNNFVNKYKNRFKK